MKTRIPSPSRSQGSAYTPRRSRTRGSRSVGSPARSTNLGRKLLVQQVKDDNMDSFVVSPINEASILTDNTDIEQPQNQNWWKRLDDNSREIMEVLHSKKDDNVNDVLEDYMDVEVQSHGGKNYSLDLPDSSGSESIGSIVLPQRKLFTQKENKPQHLFSKVVGPRESLAKLQKTVTEEKPLNVGPKKLFGPAQKRSRPIFPSGLLSITPNKTIPDNGAIDVAPKRLFGQNFATKSKAHFPPNIVLQEKSEINEHSISSQSQATKAKPVFPSALLNISPNKTSQNKTKDLTTTELKGEARTLFGHRAGAKRKNMFADFITAESEDEISETPPKIFAFQKVYESKNRSPRFSIPTDMELDEWKMIPSSTLMFDHRDDMVPGMNPLEQTLVCNSKNDEEAREHGSGNILGNLSVQQNEEPSEIEQEQSSMNSQNNKKIATHEPVVYNSKNDKEASEHGSENICVEQNEELSNIEREQSLIDCQNNEKEVTHEIVGLNSKNDKEASEQGSGNISVEQNEEPSDVEQEQSSINSQNNEEAATYEPEVCHLKNNKGNEHESENILVEQNKKQSEIEQEQSSINSQNNEEVATHEPVFGNSKNDEKASECGSGNIFVEQNEEQSDIEKEQSLINSQNNEKATTHELVCNSKNDEEASEHGSGNILVEQNEEQSDIEKEQSLINSQNNEKATTHELVCNSKNDEEASEHGSGNILVEQNEEPSDTEQEQSLNSQDNEKAATHEEIDENVLDNGSEEQSDNDEDLSIVDELNYSEEESELDKNVSDHENEEQSENEQEQSVADSLNDDKSATGEVDENEQEQPLENSFNHEKEATDEEMVESVSEIHYEEEEEEQSVEDDFDEEQQPEEEIEKSEHEIQTEYVEQSAEDILYSEKEIDYALKQNMSNNQHVKDIMEHSGVENNEIKESPDITHDTTGRNRKKMLRKSTAMSPEAILYNKENIMESSVLKGRNTSIRMNNSILNPLNIRPSLQPSARDSIGANGSDSSAQGSGWDSHRTTRKTLRQTFGKDFTPRKSLRALVMEKSAKQKTFADEVKSIHADNITLPQANSTEINSEISPPIEFDDVNTTEDSDHEISKRTRQATLEMYLQKLKRETIERKQKMECAVRDSLKAPKKTPMELFKLPAKTSYGSRKSTKTVQNKPNHQVKSSAIPLGVLPRELIEELKYKPPKRFAPNNASWITKRLYKFLENKLEPKYDYKARVRAEKLVESLYDFSKYIRRHDQAPLNAIEELKHEMARLSVVNTHFEFYEFFHEFMPREIRTKVIPDLVNKLPLPKHGVFTDIIRESTYRG